MAPQMLLVPPLGEAAPKLHPQSHQLLLEILSRQEVSLSGGYLGVTGHSHGVASRALGSPHGALLHPCFPENPHGRKLGGCLWGGAMLMGQPWGHHRHHQR